jgi:hypothetical protein
MKGDRLLNSHTFKGIDISIKFPVNVAASKQERKSIFLDKRIDVAHQRGDFSIFLRVKTYERKIAGYIRFSPKQGRVLLDLTT